MKHRSYIALAGVAALLTLTACGSPSSSSDSDNADNGASSEAKIVARVNDEPITKPALDAQVKAMSQRGQQVPPQQALDNLIQLKLMTQKAEDEGMTNDPDIQAQIERQRSSLIAQKLVRSKMDDFNVDDDELKKAYDERVGDMADTEYKARHILVESEDKAKKMIDKLDNGADFEKLAEENSTGPTKKKGGELGWFSADQMVKPFVEAAKDMDKGDYSDKPVKSQYGWHVIQLQDTREAEKPDFKDLKQKLRNQLIGQKIQDYISDLRENGDVEIVDDNLESGGGLDSMQGQGKMQGSNDNSMSSENSGDSMSGESGDN